MAKEKLEQYITLRASENSIEVSARKAGYSYRYAIYALEKKPSVQKAIERKRNKNDDWTFRALMFSDAIKQNLDSSEKKLSRIISLIDSFYERSLERIEDRITSVEKLLGIAPGLGGPPNTFKVNPLSQPVEEPWKTILSRYKTH